LEYEQIVQRTLAAAMQQHDAGVVCIMVPTADGRALRVAGSHGLDSAGAANEPLALDRSISDWISSAREQLSTWDGSGPLPAVFEPPFAGRHRGVALPMVAGGNFYGILEFSSRAARRRLSLGQVKALDILANTAASAFEADSLLSQLRSMNQDLERRVQDRTRELEASNADLESFSYSVSHDLRAPLRAIDGFCQILVSEYAHAIPDEGRDFLAKVCAAAARMQHLIDDLLHLARFSRQPLAAQRVHMMNLTRRVASSLEDQNRRVQLEIAELPDCEGDGSLIEQVLMNLLSNAFKFTATRDPARIEVGAFRQENEHVYFVRDNGVGFDMQYADKLFGVFQRMHTQAQFPGTGIGLSIVHRIVRRHGGRTWAESRPQEGTTLYFSLPIATEAIVA
jgi:signal transduction histidine kinase